MAENEAKKAQIHQLKSQIRAFEDYTEKQLETFNREIAQWEKSVEAAKRQRDGFERDMKDKKKALEHRIRSLEE